MKEAKSNPFDRFSLFEELSGQQKAVAFRSCFRQKFERGQMVLDHSAEDKDIFFVLSGSARVVIYGSSGKEVSFRDLNRGDFFGEFAALDDGPRSACIIASSKLDTLRMKQTTFIELVYAHRSVCNRLLVHLVKLLRYYSKRVVHLGILPVSARLHAEILFRSRSEGIASQESGEVHINPFPTHSELATRLGTHREAITRELRRLSTNQIVRTKRGTLIVLDMKRLIDLVVDCDPTE